VRSILWVSALILLILPLFWQSLVIPRIYGIEPELPEAGGIITIRGRNFGTGGIPSSVILDGIHVDASLTILWKPDSVMLRVPRGFDSGLVTVHTPLVHSAPVMLITRTLVPEFTVRSEPAAGLPAAVAPSVPPQGTSRR
jgi:hypothetical protein